MKQLSAILFVLVVGACGKGGSGAAKMKTVDLGDSGFVVDVPEGWSVQVPMKGFFDFKGGRPAPQIMVSPMKASSADEIVKGHCDGRADIKKEALPGGGAFVSCKGESKMMKGVTTTQIVAEIPNGEETFKCHLETDKDVETVTKICKSIRKK